MAGNITQNAALLFGIVLVAMILSIVLSPVKTVVVQMYGTMNADAATSATNWWTMVETMLAFGMEIIIFFIFYTTFFGGQEFRVSTFLIDYILAILFTAFTMYAMQYVLSSVGSNMGILTAITNNLVPMMIANLIIGGLAAVMKADQHT